MSTAFPWHDAAWRRLQQQQRGGRLPHALLISGAPGLGKQALAERLAAQLLCRQPDEAGACGRCPACHLIAAGSHPDIRHITREDDSRVIRIDSVRQLTEFMAMKSQYGGYRLGLIHPADVMNTNAANSLLKTLEEPPPGAMLVLISDRPSRIPATVRSRCQQIPVPVPERVEAVAWLEQTAPELARRAVAMLPLAGGAPLQALKQAEAGIDQRLQDLGAQLDALATGRSQPADVAAAWPKDELPLLLDLLPHLIHQLIRQQSGAQAEGIVPQAASGLRASALHEYLATVYNYRALAERSLNAELVAEDLFIRWHRICRQAA
ncbi:MAG: DNA polymerase III subunit delta' [Ectothiorhodospiraceae bacterium]|nr:DNA polymerase III subunit delta' [Ectothiorhodospiraceae bacterium]